MQLGQQHKANERLMSFPKIESDCLTLALG